MDRKFKVGDTVKRLMGSSDTTYPGFVGKIVRTARGDCWTDYYFEGGAAGAHWDRTPDGWELVQVRPVIETTVIKKVINEGTFDGVSVMAVQDKAVQLRMAPTSNGTTTWFEASDIRSMISVLGQLADALEAA